MLSYQKKRAKTTHLDDSEQAISFRIKSDKNFFVFSFKGKYSTRSDVWSFGVTLWEMLCFCRHSPYHALTNQDVITNLQHLSVDEEADFFEFLEKPPNCPRDIYQLICDTWCRNDEDRPTFWEIHCFLSRKNITFCTEMINRELPAYIEAHSHAQQYIV